MVCCSVAAQGLTLCNAGGQGLLGDLIHRNAKGRGDYTPQSACGLSTHIRHVPLADKSCGRNLQKTDIAKRSRLPRRFTRRMTAARSVCIRHPPGGPHSRWGRHPKALCEANPSQHGDMQTPYRDPPDGSWPLNPMRTGGPLCS